MYPNPAASMVRMEGVFASDQVTVWNAMGQVVLVQKMRTADLEIGALPAGLYQVLVQRNGAIVGSGKLVKE